MCVLCRFHEQTCTYDEAPRPRKRGLSGDEQASQPSAHKRPRTLTTRPGTGVEEYDTLTGPTLLKRTLGLQNLHHSRYIGANDKLDVYSAGVSDGVSEDSTVSASQNVKVRFVHPLHAFEILPDAGTTGYETDRTVIDEIERAVRGHGPELVKLYFRIVHPAFPILHKAVFLEKYARTYREFSPPLLVAVYLLASKYWSFSEVLSGKSKPDLGKLKQLASAALKNAIRRPKLSTVQAALLISQYRTTDSRWPRDDNQGDVTSQLVDLACTLGLYLDPTDWEIPEWEIGLRRRLSWAVFMQDQWASIMRGSPPSTSDETWDVDPLTDEDFPEHDEEDAAGSSEVEKGRLVFMQMASLAVIVSAILRSVIGPRFQRRLHSTVDKLSVLLEAVKPLQIRLKEWSTALPITLRIDSTSSMKLSSVGYLRLAYLGVEVCLHRQLVKAMADTAGVNLTLHSVCQAAATERFTNALHFVQGLQAHHLTAFWYFSSAHCCLLIHHLGRALKSVTAETLLKSRLDQDIKAYEWALKVNSEAGAAFMKQALVMVHDSARFQVSHSEGHPPTAQPTDDAYTPAIPEPTVLGGPVELRDLGSQRADLEYGGRVEVPAGPVENEYGDIWNLANTFDSYSGVGSDLEYYGAGYSMMEPR